MISLYKYKNNLKNESKVGVSIFLERFFRAQIFPPLGDKLFSCLQFSKNVNFDSCSKINGWISRISIQLQFPQNAVERIFKAFLYLQLFIMVFCSITVFASISSQYRFCGFFLEEFSHQTFPKRFPLVC